VVLRRGRLRLRLLRVLAVAVKGPVCVLADNVLAVGADAKMLVCQKPEFGRILFVCNGFRDGA